MMGQRLGFLLAICVGLVSVFWPPLSGMARGLGDNGVQDFRFGVEPQQTRLVLDVKGTLNYRWFTLQNPTRVVVDFLTPAGKEIGFGAEPSSVKIPAGSRVTALRAGQFRPGVVRMVLDLSKPSRISVFAIPPRGKEKGRLVVDVMEPKRGEKPTEVAPPAEVVTRVKDTGAWNPDWGRQGLRKPTEGAREPYGVDEAGKGGGVEAQQQQTVRVVPKADGVVRIVLDPGHGGVDPGACSSRIKLCEKYLVLDMAKRVRADLGKRIGSHPIEVLMTRDSDVFIPLGERVRIAQRWGADLFVSLHADIAPSSSARGATVYMLSDRASDREAQRLADSENAGDDLAGLDLGEQAPEVRNILIDLAQRDTMNNSTYLGQSVLGRMASTVPVRKDHVLSAGFRVLKAPDIPSILVEMGYLSHPQEVRNLNDDGYRDRLAGLIANGIKGYVNNHVYK